MRSVLVTEDLPLVWGFPTPFLRVVLGSGTGRARVPRSEGPLDSLVWGVVPLSAFFFAPLCFGAS